MSAIVNPLQNLINGGFDISKKTAPHSRSIAHYGSLLEEKDHYIAFLKNQIKLEQNHTEQNLGQAIIEMDKLNEEIAHLKKAFTNREEELKELKKMLAEQKSMLEAVEEAYFNTTEELERTKKNLKKCRDFSELRFQTASSIVDGYQKSVQIAYREMKELKVKQKEEKEEYCKKIQDLIKEHDLEMDELEEDKNKEIESLRFENQQKIQEMMERQEEKIGEIQTFHDQEMRKLKNNLMDVQEEIQELKRVAEKREKEMEDTVERKERRISYLHKTLGFVYGELAEEKKQKSVEQPKKTVERFRVQKPEEREYAPKRILEEKDLPEYEEFSEDEEEEQVEQSKTYVKVGSVHSKVEKCPLTLSPEYEQISEVEDEEESVEKVEKSKTTRYSHSSSPVTCSNCSTTKTSCWRISKTGRLQCNACYLNFWSRFAPVPFSEENKENIPPV